MPLDRTVTLARALGDPSRVRVLFACRRRELCVCQITALLELAPSTVSKHLSILRTAGLLESRQRGRWIHYRLAGAAASREARAALDFLFGALARDALIAADRRRLAEILALDPDRLCERQRCAARRR
ncbi:MAG: winged helix-turn-helix transcriptional regulator [Planctomycetes bacterium]|nr:winged helix-turn-helix transcriptional regulator [Planctomycetota bacterium]